MKIRSIRCAPVRGLTGLLELDEKGLTLVTGDNGQGKTLLIETVYSTLFRENLRTGRGVIFGDGDAAQVQFHGGLVGFSSSKKERHMNVLTGTKVSMKEQQEWIESRVGTAAQWKRSCVLSPDSEFAQFSAMSGPDRLKTVESAFGVMDLQDVYGYASQDFLAAKGELFATQRSLQQHKELLAAMNKTILFSETSIYTKQQCEEKLKDLQAECRMHETAINNVAKERSGLQADIREYEVRIGSASTFINSPDCAACGGPMPQVTRERVIKDRAHLEQRYDFFQKRVVSLNSDLQRLEEDLQEFREVREAWQLEFNKANALHARNQTMEERNRLNGITSALEAEVVRRQTEYDHLNVVKEIFGPKGIRDQFIGSILSQINQRLLQWASLLLNGKSAQLMLRSENNKQGLGVLCTGMGSTIDGETDLRTLSRGERRRLDAAVSLCFSELKGYEGTLFVDEFMDSMDKEGVQAMCKALAYIAERRAVVVVSHNPLVSEAILALGAKHYRIENRMIQA